MEKAKEVKLFLTKNDLQEMLVHFEKLDLVQHLQLIADLKVEIDNFDSDSKLKIYRDMMKAIDYIKKLNHEFKIIVKENELIRLDCDSTDTEFNNKFDFPVFGLYFSIDSDIDFLNYRLRQLDEIVDILTSN